MYDNFDLMDLVVLALVAVAVGVVTAVIFHAFAKKRIRRKPTQDLQS